MRREARMGRIQSRDIYAQKRQCRVVSCQFGALMSVPSVIEVVVAVMMAGSRAA